MGCACKAKKAQPIAVKQVIKSKNMATAKKTEVKTPNQRRIVKKIMRRS